VGLKTGARFFLKTDYMGLFFGGGWVHSLPVIAYFPILAQLHGAFKQMANK